MPLSQIFVAKPTNRPTKNYPQASRVRNVTEKTNTQTTLNTIQDSDSDKHDETVDLENTLFIQVIFDNWNTVNFVKPNSFSNDKPAKISTCQQKRSRQNITKLQKLQVHKPQQMFPKT